MPSSIKSVEEFDRILEQSRKDISDLLASMPEDRALRSVHLQLEALHDWTRGRAPSQAEKDALNFGLIASRELDDFCPDVCQKPYALASYAIYW